MSVRRLAPLEIQPSSFAFTPATTPGSSQQIAKYPPGRQASAVIPLSLAGAGAGGGLGTAGRDRDRGGAARHGQDPRARDRDLLHACSTSSRSGSISSSFAARRPACCGAPGNPEDVLKRRIGGERHVSADGKFSWLEVECLGACCNAPMVQINFDYYEDLTPRIDGKLLDDLAAGRPVKPGSQSGRAGSEPRRRRDHAHRPFAL